MNSFRGSRWLVAACMFVGCAATGPSHVSTVKEREARVQREPGRVEGWRELGWARLLDGDSGGAEAAFAGAAQIVPDDSRVMLGMASLAEAGGRASEARERWMRI